MTGLFCFDGPLYKDKNGVYCNVTLTNEMFERYFSVVDKLFVVVRTFQSDETYIEMNMKPLVLNNIEVIEVDNLNTASGFVKGRKELKKRIRKLLDEIDLVFARMPSTTSDVVLSVVQEKGKSYLVEVGGCVWDAFWNHGIMGKIMAPYMYLTARKNISKADYAIYVTKEFLQRRYPNKGVTACCSNVYLENHRESVLLERLKKIERMDMKHPVLGQAVNSIDVKYKGEYLVIQAMKRLKEKGIIAEFQVVGPGNGEFLKNEAKKYAIEEQLKILGTLQKSEIVDWYKSIDIYIQPSKQEGLPRSVIEAMSVGCPALGSNVAGIPELLAEECLFNPNRIENIVDLIMKVLNKCDLIKNANRNFQIAKDYRIDLIEKRRSRIFDMYRKSII